MTRLDGKERIAATALAALAGYVDAVGFLGSGGFYASFMSGNSTRLGVALAREPALAILPAMLIVAFVAGAATGSLIGYRSGARRVPAILLVEAVLLAVAPLTTATAGLALVAFAMGAQNLLFEEDGEVRFGLTYMTGALVKVGQRLARVGRPGEAWGWSPFALLWLGLVAGAAGGTASFAAFGFGSLWGAAGAALAMAALGAAVPLALTRPVIVRGDEEGDCG